MNHSITTPFLAAASIVIIVSLIAGELRKDTRRSLLTYFWGGHDLSKFSASQLILSSSFSLNGLLYHAWLGYSIGVYSLAIQGIWILSFIWLSQYADKLQVFCGQDTLHGNIHRYYTHNAGKLAAVASIIGFAGLTGWELTVASSITRSALGIDSVLALPFALLIAFVAVIYTVRGGISGNAIANTVQNVIKAVSAVVLIYAAFNLVPDSLRSVEVSDSATKFDVNPILIIGAFAFISNALFSVFWQFADMSTWQNVSSATHSAKTPRMLLMLSSAQIFVFPGLVGTLVGIGLHNVDGIDGDNIINVAIDLLRDSPILLGIVYAGLIAAMFATIDGYLIASSQAITWDILKRKEVRSLLDKGEELSERDYVSEASILSTSYFFIFVFAVISAAVFVAINTGGVSLFHIVYIAVIGQMSLVPAIMRMLRKKTSTECGLSGATPSIAAGLLFGGGCIIWGVYDPTGIGLTVAPIATLVASWFALLVGGKND